MARWRDGGREEWKNILDLTARHRRWSAIGHTFTWALRRLPPVAVRYFLGRSTSVTIAGIRVPVPGDISAVLQDELVRYRSYETAEIDILQARLTKRDVVLEVGTGLGLVASYCARRIGSHRVFTFEANPSMAPLIRDTFALNGVWPELQLGTLGSRGEARPFYVERDFWASSTIRRSAEATAIEVPVLPVNEVLQRIRPTFLLIDIEGGECELLKCMDLQSIQKVVVELHPDVTGLQAAEEVSERLTEAGLTICRTDSRANLLYAERNLSTHDEHASHLGSAAPIR